jgi:hypothetical protein
MAITQSEVIYVKVLVSLLGYAVVVILARLLIGDVFLAGPVTSCMPLLASETRCITHTFTS